MRYLYMRFWEEDKNSTVSCTPALITAVKKKKKMYKKKKLTMGGAQYLHTADTNVNVCTSLQVEYVCSFLVGCLVTSAWKQHTFAVLHLMRQMQRDLWSTRLLR